MKQFICDFSFVRLGDVGQGELNAYEWVRVLGYDNG